MEGHKEISIIFDSGCTISVTRCESDVIGFITPVSKTMRQLGVNAKLVCEGLIKLCFNDDFGVLQHIQARAYLVSSVPITLFSPQSHFKKVRSENGGSKSSFTLNSDGFIFAFSSGKIMSYTYSSTSNLPVDNSLEPPKESGFISDLLTISGWLDISKIQEDLLKQHGIFGHQEVRQTQYIISTQGLNLEPIVIPNIPNMCTCNIPLCKYCITFKGRRTYLHSTRITLHEEYYNVIKVGDLEPGDCIIIDQFECKIK